MRLSLRTLLAFEDNIFDTEQHRQLERLIPRHDAAAMMLGRIRRVIRDPGLGVPGLLDEREELDPNIVAEYLDHQMAAEVQDRYETFCLSSDKCLAETASIHQVLSNVLGEPARTSRECRLRCYDLYGAASKIPSPGVSFETTQVEERLQTFVENDKTVSVESQLAQPVERDPEPVLRLYPTLPENTESATKSPVTGPVNADPIVERIPTAERRPFFSLIRSFFLGKKPASEEVKETVSLQRGENDDDKRSQGFSFWMLLLFFLLGIGVFSGWRSLQDGFKSSETPQVSSVPGKDHSPPMPPQKITAVIPVPAEAESVKAVVVAPKAEPKVVPKPEPPKPVETKTVPVVAETKAEPPAPTKEAPKKIAAEEPKKQPENPGPASVAKPVEKSGEKGDEVVEAKPAPVTPPPVPPQEKIEVTEAKTGPPPPIPHELSEIVSAEPKKQAEKPMEKPAPKKAEVVETAVVVPPLPTAPPPEKEAPQKEEAKKIETSKVAAEEPKIQAKPETVNATAPPPIDPFLSAPVPTESVQTVSWNSHPGVTLSFQSPPATDVKNEPPGTFAEKAENPATANEPTNPFNDPTPRTLPLEPTPLSKPMASFAAVPGPDAKRSVESAPRNKPSLLPLQEPDVAESLRPIPVPRPDPLQEPSREPLIAFQPISRVPQRRLPERRSPESVSPSDPVEPRKTLRYEPVSTAEPAPNFGKVVHPIATARQFGEVATVSEVRETDPNTLGRVLPQPEPCVLFSAPSAGEQWDLKAGPLDLHAEQYLLTVTPYRIDVEVGGTFRIEMVGDTKMCILPPDENGVPGIFVDYGRLVIRPNPSIGAETPCTLYLRTEHAEGNLTMKDARSLAFIDTFAEALPESVAAGNVPTKATKTSPILALLPAAGQTMQWQPADRTEPMTTQQQNSVLLKPGSVGFGTIRSLPNWLQRTPLPVEGRQLAEICAGIFQSHTGNCEAALHALILQDNLSVRFFGYRLWGDLGRFDIPLSLLAETKPEEEPVRQVLVPYFREVMKRDEETIQRFADAIETVRK